MLRILESVGELLTAKVWGRKLVATLLVMAAACCCTGVATAQIAASTMAQKNAPFDPNSNIKPGVDSPIRDGEVVYRNVCTTCHANGAKGAPRFGDRAAWSVRVTKGLDTLVKNVTVGSNGTPVNGGCKNCTDPEIRGAVIFMLSKSL